MPAYGIHRVHPFNYHLTGGGTPPWGAEHHQHDSYSPHPRCSTRQVWRVCGPAHQAGQPVGGYTTGPGLAS
jgi:hypothetical protein